MKSIFQEELYVPGSLSAISAGDYPIGYEFSLRIADVRGTHLSCVENFTVTQDGEAVPSGLIQFCLNGKAFSPSEFPGLAYEYWRIDEEVRVRVLNGTDPKDLRDLSVSFGMRVPYTGTWGNCAVPPFHCQIMQDGKQVKE